MKKEKKEKKGGREKERRAGRETRRSRRRRDRAVSHRTNRLVSAFRSSIGCAEISKKKKGKKEEKKGRSSSRPSLLPVAIHLLFLSRPQEKGEEGGETERKGPPIPGALHHSDPSLQYAVSSPTGPGEKRGKRGRKAGIPRGYLPKVLHSNAAALLWKGKRKKKKEGRERLREQPYPPMSRYLFHCRCF